MSHSDKPEVGSITWTDLTVTNAEELRDFYNKVVGWNSEPVSMGSYDDFNMKIPSNDNVVAGICHAHGANKNLPPQWLIYITVENLDQSAAECVRLGGKVIEGPKDMGDFGRFCVIQDPAGAFAALNEVKIK